jgi:hypothetical protein
MVRYGTTMHMGKKKPQKKESFSAMHTYIHPGWGH